MSMQQGEYPTNQTAGCWHWAQPFPHTGYFYAPKVFLMLSIRHTRFFVLYFINTLWCEGIYAIYAY